MLKDMFCWMVRDLSEFKQNPTELFDDCLEKDIGQFIHHYNWEFVDSLLDLSDDEMTEIYPNNKCPFSYQERQSLKKKLYIHVLSCSACTNAELRNDAIDLMMEKSICKNSRNHQLALIN